MRSSIRRTHISIGVVVAALVYLCLAVHAQDGRIRYLNQGTDWTAAARQQFYSQGQGSELIPLAWLEALRQANGALFLEGSLARYGYIAYAQVAIGGLPIGFTVASSDRGPMVGMTCAACHERQIDVAGKSYRIDGAPALADFAGFATDLDAAVRRVLDDGLAFETFADAVLGGAGTDLQRATLQAEVRYWWTRFHALIGGTLPSSGHSWGPGRLDEMAVIYNSVAGLDVGPAPLFLMPGNIHVGDAPVRYAFLWNADKQDFTGWAGLAENGNRPLALARNLGKLYGTFGTFRPLPTSGSVTVLDRNYLTVNSASLAGLDALEALVGRMGPPAWPWSVDVALARRGEAIFDRPTADGGCVACHGLRAGLRRPSADVTWATTVADVGTDTRVWQGLRRSIATGNMQGASIPGFVAPLETNALAFTLIKTSVLGTIIDQRAAADLANPFRVLLGAPRVQNTSAQMPIALPTSRYEARVLQGVWAAAPFLHNGSVPTLADLLKPAARRPRTFKVGPAYDPTTIGLAIDQPASSFTMHATGCEDRDSGDSDCGHEFGTSLPDADKQALIEYMKTL